MIGARQFEVGAQYTRLDLFRILGVPTLKGGNWYTGYNAHGADWFIFCGVGAPGRTGHDYQNHFLGKELVWYGKTGSKLHQPSIRSLIKPGARVHVFYRQDDRSPFTYAGLARPIRTTDVSPVEVVWSFSAE